MACADIYINDVGTIFRAVITDQDGAIVDLTSGSGEFIFRKPSGAKFNKLATFYGPPSSGTIQYMTVANDINEVGDWKYQAIAYIPAGTFHTNTVKLKVGENI